LTPIDFSKAKVIVELGPGTGVFTRALLKEMMPQATLLAFEINDSLVKEIKKIRDPRLRVLKVDATRLARTLEELDVTPDYIVSGLPLRAMKTIVRNSILEDIKSVLEEGKYIQFQYTRSLEKILQKMFNVKRAHTLLNIPPAYVYTCTKK
jgi:phospholipid N-methyltransferase